MTVAAPTLPFRRRALTVACALLLTSPLALADDKNDTTLPTVIVTADKIGRSLIKTPASLVVLNADDVDRRAGTQSVKDVLANTPNIVYVGTGNIAPAVRGIDSTGASQGSDAFIAGSRARLNIQIDGRPASYNEIVFGDALLWDVQQVEVLRGAQSTLQGRNAISGTIATKTKDPTFTPEGAIRFSAGNYDQRRASAAVSAPIIDDNLAFRLAGDWWQKTSYVEGWQPFPTVDDPREFESTNLRGKLLLKPQAVPAWQTLLTVNYADYEGPQTENVDRPFGKYESNSFIFEPVFQPRTTSAIIDTQYAFNEALAFEALVTGTDFKVRRKAQPDDGIALIEGDEYTIEPRLRFQSDIATGVVGVFFYRAHQDEFLDLFVDLNFDDRINTRAIFGETTISLSDHFDLIVGARYEEEHHEREGGDDTQFIAIALDETYRAFLPKLGVAWNIDPSTTLGAQISRGYNGGGAGAAFEAVPVVNYQYDPEYVTTLELYGRKEMAGGRVRLTGNIFYSDYKDMQLTKDLTPEDQSDFSFVVINADKVKTYGLEAGVTWLATSSLELYANVGAIKTDIAKYDGSYEGNELANAPSFSASGGVTWNYAGFDANFNGRYLDSYYSDIANQPRGKVDPYFVANAEIGYTFDTVRVYAEVTNLFDSDAPIALYPGATREEDGGNVLAPRMFNIGVQMNF